MILEGPTIALSRVEFTASRGQGLVRMISGYEIANVFLLVYAGLFPIFNPIGGAPIFLGLTLHCTEDERHALALGVTLNSFFLLLGSLMVARDLLSRMDPENASGGASRQNSPKPIRARFG